MALLNSITKLYIEMLKTWLLGSKPYAIFDAANAEHRAAYNDFVQHKTWRDSPYQFVCEEPYLDLPTNINAKLLTYYLNQEFSTKVHTEKDSQKVSKY